MVELPTRELRNNTSALLRRVSAGEEVVITVSGVPAARLVPYAPVASTRRWIPRAELASRLAASRADPGLRDDLAALTPDTTDDLGPIE
jgi:prevent-host-death family protein